MDKHRGPIEYLRNSKNADPKYNLLADNKASMQSLRVGKHIAKSSLKDFSKEYQTQRDL